MAMVQAGILKPKGFTPMAADDTTKKAFARLLTEANSAGMRWGDYLTGRVNLASMPGGAPLGSLGSVRDPLVVEHENPDNIRAQVSAQATNLLGGNYAGDPQHYVDEIAAQETKAQTDEYNKGGPDGGGGSVYKPADVDALMIKEHPVDYGVEQSGRNAQAVLEGLLSRHAPDSRG
jgi:hypothetical protein